MDWNGLLDYRNGILDYWNGLLSRHNMKSMLGQQTLLLVKLVAMLGLVPTAQEMETMENAFSCVQERPGNETSYTYESSEL